MRSRVTSESLGREPRVARISSERPLKVLHVVANTRRRGAEVFASDLIRELNAHDVEQVVSPVKADGESQVSFDAPRVSLASAGWHVPGLRMRPAAVRRLSRLLRAWRPDVVQAHGGEPLKYAVLARWGLDVPIVYRRIGGAPRWLRRAPRRLVHTALMRRAAYVVTVAEAVREETLDLLGLPEGQVMTIANAIDPARAAGTRAREEIRRELGIVGDAPVMVSVGSLSWEKDPLVQLTVARRVLAEQPRAVHLIVGDGPLRPMLEAKIAGMWLNGRVKLLGVRNDIGDLLSVADVFLFTSREDGMEGMPATLIEAGMAGIPVVAYDVAGVREIVADGVTGRVVPRGDVSGLVESVQGLSRDEELRRRLGLAARSFCRSRFDISVVAPKYLDLYLRLLESK